MPSEMLLNYRLTLINTKIKMVRIVQKKTLRHTIRGQGSFYAVIMVRLAGFEPTTPGSASQCSNPLSYKRKIKYRLPASRHQGTKLCAVSFWCRGRDLNPHIRKDTAT